ncbi:hypothetical protein L1049_000943 [Liquidambar formosana]|uniref:Potassium channel domain-containing protein n=1 Tax=Liquidambar formosana TaxID=63359 RepID=A0AAP0R5T4_LIQFO
METMTTVGYGDLVPHRSLSKLFSCIFSFSGMFLVGLILSKAAEYLVAKQELLLVKALHLHQKVGPTETLKEIEPKRVRFKCIIVAIVASGHMFVGTIFLSSIEEMDFLDALYCVCSTMTTLGYGDKSFQTPFGRFFAVFWILSSSTCLAHLYFYVTEYYVQGRQRSLVNWVLAWRMRSLDLEAADLDDDGFVGAAEFIIYKLKEKGKISEEDIELVREEMEELDVDQPRTLSASDIMLAQSNETGK